MRGLTYEDLALRYEVDVCPGGCGLSGHERGFIRGGLIHWTTGRRVTRAGLRHFLMLIAPLFLQRLTDERWLLLLYIGDRDINLVTNSPRDEARQLYLWSLFAYRTALFDLGIRFPGSLAEMDKAKVRALLANAPTKLRRSRVGRWAGLR